MSDRGIAAAVTTVALDGCGFSNQIHSNTTFLGNFDYPGVTGSQDGNGCLRTLSLENAFQKPMSGITDTTSTFLTVYGYNTHQVWSQYGKLLQRYSLTFILACSSLNSFMRYSMVCLINLNSITFCQHRLKKISANFGENQTNRLGQVHLNLYFTFNLLNVFIV